MRRSVLFLLMSLFLILLTNIAISQTYNWQASEERGVAQQSSANWRFNFTITNNWENITQVNITLPNGFSFILGTNDTTAEGATFYNTSDTLIWENSTCLIANNTQESFYFNTTIPSTLGSYNFTITVKGISGTVDQMNVTIKVQNISVSITLDNTTVNPGQNITVSGQALLLPDNTPVANNSISIWLDGTRLIDTDGDGILEETTWWNSNWKYRKPILISNQAGNLTDYQVKIEINLSQEFSQGKIQQYCQDVRFTWLNTTSNQEQKIPYWIEECNLSANDNATFWIKVPFLENNTNTTVYLYYGNPSASSESDGDAVFEFFDDFEGIELDTTKWQTFGTFDALEVINGELHGKTEQGSALVVSKSTFDRNIIIESVTRLISREIGEAYLVQDIDNWMNNYYFKGDQWYERIKRRKSGSESVLATQTVSLAFNTYYLLKTILKSSDIIFKIYDMDGNLKVTVTASDTTWSNGYVGFRTYGSSGSPSEWYVDWIRIRKYTSPEPSIASIGEEQVITSTDSQGNYSYTFKAPLEAGTHEIKVNLTDPNGIYGENSTTFTVTGAIVRNVTIAISVAEISSRTGSWYRNIKEAYTTQLEISRYGSFHKETTETFTAEHAVSKSRSIVESLLSLIDISDIASFLGTYYREYNLPVSLLGIPAREIYALRYSSLSFSVTSQAIREIGAGRSIYLQAKVTPEIARLLNISKESKITLIVTPELARLLGLHRESELTITFTPQLLKILQTSKEFKETLTVTPELLKKLIAEREKVQAISSILYVSRAISLLRPIDLPISTILSVFYEKIIPGIYEIYQPVSLVITSEREISSYRSVEYPISFQIITTRVYGVFRALFQAFTGIFTVDKTATLGRVSFQNVTVEPATIREINLSREITAKPAFQTVIEVFSGAIRGIFDTISSIFKVERTVGLGREYSQNLTATIELSREINASREIPTETTFQLFVERFKGFYRSIFGFIDIQSFIERIASIFRQPTLEEHIFTKIDRIGTFGREVYKKISFTLTTLGKKVVVVVAKYYNITIYTQEYAPGDTVYIYAIVTPSVTEAPSIAIYYPNTTLLLEDTMNLLEDNIYYYTLTAPNVKGDYLIKVTVENSTAINTFRVSGAYYEAVGGIGIDIHTTGDFFYYPGNIVKIPFVITSRTDGKPVDYDSIKITIYNPSMEVIAEDPIPTKISTGIYYIDYNLSDLADYGVYPVIINATYQSYHTARIATFKVLPPAPVELSVETDKEQVFQGGSLSAKFTIKNERYKTEYATLEYTLYDSDKEEILYKGTTQLVLSPQQTTEITRTLYIPLEAPTGLGIVEGKLTLKDSTVFTYAYITISARAKGIVKNKYILTFNNLTPEEQYVEIYRNNTLVFKGVVKKGYSVELERGTYKIKMYVEGRKPNEFILTLDRDMVIDSQLVEKYPTWYYLWLYKGPILAFVTVLVVGWYLFKSSKRIQH